MSMGNEKYRYYAYDLYDHVYFAFETRGDLLHWRYAHCHDQDLNVTGKDTFAYLKWQPESEWEEPEYYLRRWQIFDKDWRSIDIRGWEPTEADVRDSLRHIGSPYKRNYAPGAGTGQHSRSGHSFFGYKGSRIACIILSEFPEITEHQGRLRSRKVPEESYSRFHHSEKWPSRSWKDQTKARKQWAKHKQRDRRARREDLGDPWEEYDWEAA